MRVGFLFLRWFARQVRPVAGPLIAWILRHMSFLIPTKRLRENEHLVAFYHPTPSYPVHILLAPKKAITSLAALEVSDRVLLAEVVACVQSLVDELGLEQMGYRLIVNGGKYQEIPQLHFHLVADAIR